MKRRNVFLVLICIVFFTSFQKIYSENFVGKRIFSFDFGYLSTGLLNQGWGLGLNYEFQIFDCLSIKPGFSHMTIWPKDLDLTITTVGVNLNFLYYPFNKGLEWLYIGSGCETDFLMYNGSEFVEKMNDSVISVYPIIGWKQYFLNFLMLDLYCDYRIVLGYHSLPEPISYLSTSRFEYGIKIKLNLKEIYEKMKKNKKSEKKQKKVKNIVDTF